MIGCFVFILKIFVPVDTIVVAETTEKLINNFISVLRFTFSRDGTFNDFLQNHRAKNIKVYTLLN